MRATIARMRIHRRGPRRKSSLRDGHGAGRGALDRTRGPSPPSSSPTAAIWPASSSSLRSRRRGAPLAVAGGHGVRAVAKLLDGELAEAGGDSDIAMHIPRGVPLPAAVGVWAGGAIRIAASRGDFAAAEAMLATCATSSRSSTWGGGPSWRQRSRPANEGPWAPGRSSRRARSRSRGRRRYEPATAPRIR